MIKRVVILQDEQLVVREIERNMQRMRQPSPVAACSRLAGMPPAAGCTPVGFRPAFPPCSSVDGA